MKTWAKQLEEALPNADQEVRNCIMDTFCPRRVLGDEFAPEYRVWDKGWETLDEECEKCWDSCDSKCRYERGAQND